MGNLDFINNKQVWTTSFSWTLSDTGINYQETFLYLKDGVPSKVQNVNGSLDDGDWKRITRFVYRHTLEAEMYRALNSGRFDLVIEIYDKIKNMTDGKIAVS